MKKVYSSENAPLVGYLKSILDSCNIHCLIKNEHLGGGAGQLPPIECWPELWITEDADFQYAERIITSTLAEPETQTNGWSCLGCGEFIEGQFAVCWQCGENRPG